MVQLYSCLDRIRTMEWCSRSEYIVCGLQNKQIVQVRNIMGAGFLLACPSYALHPLAWLQVAVRNMQICNEHLH